MCSINHELKAIYIHLPKNGGLYVQKILEDFYNFKTLYFTHENHNDFSDLNVADIEPENNGFINFKKKGLLRYHMSSEKYNTVANLSQEKWKSYYKFTFIRNPYDKLVSAYKYINSNNYANKKVSFHQFIDNKDMCSDYTYFHAFISQYQQLLDLNNEMNINYFGKFENLNTELIHILKNIGVKKISHYPVIEKNIAINRSIVDKNYASYYDDELLQKVNKIFDEDFVHFNYKKNENIEDLMVDSEKFYISNDTLQNKNKRIMESILLQVNDPDPDPGSLDDFNLLDKNMNNVNQQLLLNEIKEKQKIQKKREEMMGNFKFIKNNLSNLINLSIKQQSAIISYK